MCRTNLSSFARLEVQSCTFTRRRQSAESHAFRVISVLAVRHREFNAKNNMATFSFKLYRILYRWTRTAVRFSQHYIYQDFLVLAFIIKAKEFSFMVKTKAKTLDIYAVFKDTSRLRPRLRTDILADLHVHNRRFLVLTKGIQSMVDWILRSLTTYMYKYDHFYNFIFLFLGKLLDLRCHSAFAAQTLSVKRSYLNCGSLPVTYRTGRECVILISLQLQQN